MNKTESPTIVESNWKKKEQNENTSRMYLHSAFHELFEYVYISVWNRKAVDFVCVEKYTLSFLAYNMSVSREK